MIDGLSYSAIFFHNIDITFQGSFFRYPRIINANVIFRLILTDSLIRLLTHLDLTFIIYEDINRLPLSRSRDCRLATKVQSFPLTLEEQSPKATDYPTQRIFCRRRKMWGSTMRELLFPFREPVDSWTAGQKFDSTVAEWSERQWLTQSKYSPQRLWHPQSSPHHLLPLRQPLRTNKRFRLYLSRQYRRIKWLSDWEQLSL